MLRKASLMLFVSKSKKEDKAMKKRITRTIFLMTMFVCLLAATCVSAQASDKTKIVNAVTKKIGSTGMIYKTFYGDFDKNGRSEAFVLTCKKADRYEDLSWRSHTLWFGYVKSGKAYVSALKKDVMASSKILKLKSVWLFAATGYAATSAPQTVYKVSGNKAKVIFYGDSIYKVSGNTFLSVHSTYDASYQDGMYTGHTWKPYYFYYKSGKIKQYTASYITEAQFKKKYSNASSMLSKYKANGTVSGILVRSNNRVHINYAKKKNGYVEYSYVTFAVSGNTLKYKTKGAGKYLPKI